MGDTESKSKPEATLIDRFGNPIETLLQKGEEALREENYEDAITLFRRAFAAIQSIIDEGGCDEETLRELLKTQAKLTAAIPELQKSQDQQERDQLESTSGRREVMARKEDLKVDFKVDKKKRWLRADSSTIQWLIDNVNVSWPQQEFERISGQEAAIRAIDAELVERWRRPQSLGGLEPKLGLIFVAPLGSSQTILTIAKAVAKECGDMAFFEVDVAQLLCSWEDEQMESVITALFMLASRNGPSVIFLDDVTPLFKSNGDNGFSGDTLTMLVEQLAAEHPNILFLCATSSPWELHRQFLRRFCPIFIELPTRDARLRILRSVFKGQDHFLLQKDFEYMADQTDGFSPYDLNDLFEKMVGTANRFTYRSEYFRLTGYKRGFEKTWAACDKNDPEAQRRSFASLPRKDAIAHQPVNGAVMRECLDRTMPTVSKATIEKMTTFKRNPEGMCLEWRLAEKENAN